ncbi:MAG: AAA family ATPase [Gammaproteobacteria bacterium]|nr:AAA family ATPase [Gammaproteobacteria bacterium]
MRLAKLHAEQYRSLRYVTVEMDGLNLFIGPNAAGKSTVLDTLRFLHEGANDRDFTGAVRARGGIIHLAWKGESAEGLKLAVEMDSDGSRFEWTVRLTREGYDFHVDEQVQRLQDGSPPVLLLKANKGEGWWWSGQEGGKVYLKQAPTTCALSTAAADASFPAREVAEFVQRWGFFDPNPFLLRRDWSSTEFRSFDPYGRNLAETLHGLHQSAPDVFRRILEATQDVLGLPTEIEPRESDDRFYFVQREPGLQFAVHQMGVSSGTLRMLALMTALFSEPKANLIGIEEPENYVHPTAIASFVDYIRSTQNRTQFIVTTHSPLLLDYLGDPSVVRVVQRREDGATAIADKADNESIKHALQESGFGLGAFYETQGFGAN